MKRKKLGSQASRYRKLSQMYQRLFPNSADRMWAMRAMLGLSQQQLADQCGLSSGFFSRLECGYSLPRGNSLQKIVQNTGLSADFILGVDEMVDVRVASRTTRQLHDAESEMTEGRPAARRAKRKQEKSLEIAADRLMAATG